MTVSPQQTQDREPRREPLIEVRDFVTEFRTPRGVVRAVDGVSFSLERGETMGIVGESGSGKTVLARSIMKLVRGANTTRTGSVRFEGTEIIDAPLADMRKIWSARISMIFQDPMTALHPLHRIGWQIAEPLREHESLSKREARERCVEILRSLGIPEPGRRVDQYPHELSGGMRQRVMIGIALACLPSLVFADEPTTALDVTVQAQILDLLGRHQRERRMAMVLVSHDLGVVTGRTQRVAVMYAGQVVEEGPTREVMRAPRMPYTEALLRSTPRLDEPGESRLPTIPGRPPNPIDFPRGCRFAPRCAYVQQKCRDEAPPLVTEDGRSYRCFFPVPASAGAAGAQTRAAATVGTRS